MSSFANFYDKEKLGEGGLHSWEIRDVIEFSAFSDIPKYDVTHEKARELHFSSSWTMKLTLIHNSTYHFASSFF